MSPSHKYIRNVLRSLCNLHKSGYGKLRFMISYSKGVYSVRIGPKRVFAMHDGLYIPENLRHRSLLIPSETEIFDQNTVLRGQFLEEERPLIKQLRYTILGRNCEDSSIDDGLLGADPDYTKWLIALTSLLNDFDFALPMRNENEHLSQQKGCLRVEFVETPTSRPIAPTIRFDSPPGGIIQVTRAPTNNDYVLAHPRDKESPILLWNVRAGPTQDQIIDNVYENSLMGGGKS